MSHAEHLHRDLPIWRAIESLNARSFDTSKPFTAKLEPGDTGMVVFITYEPPSPPEQAAAERSLERAVALLKPGVLKVADDMVGRVKLALQELVEERNSLLKTLEQIGGKDQD